MTIGNKISLSSAVLVLFTAILAATTLIGVNSLNGRVKSLQSDSIPGLRQSAIVAVQIKELRIKMNAELLDLAAEGGKQSVQMRASLATEQTKLADALRSYEKTIVLAVDREIFKAVGVALDRVYQTWNGVRAASQRTKNEAEILAQYRREVVPAFGVLDTETERLLEENEDNATGGAALAETEALRVQKWNWIIALASLASGILLAFVIVRGLNRVLRRAVQELADGAEQVASAAGQVAASSQALAQGASQQAASLEETSASSEEINSMAGRNSNHSRSAADLVAQSQQKFEKTSECLEQTVLAMSEINAQSGRISKIIKVIDEIAFQTNILALNAAVEAARAGGAGLGFAVVADEVRNLAQRCAQAAKDTATLIEESIAKSNDGKVKVDEVAAAMAAITAESVKVKMLVDEVNLGSQEQTRGMQEIGKAVIQMEQVTQRTAANAEEGAAAAEELTAQSETLKEVVARLTAMVGISGNRGVAKKTSVDAGGTRNGLRLVKHPGGSPALAARRPAETSVAAESMPAPVGMDAFPLDDSNQG